MNGFTRMYPHFVARLIAFSLIAFGLAACGGEASDQETAASEAAALSEGEILIQPIGNEMRYEQTEFTVEAGQEVTIVFENLATSPAMQHNVVVLTSDDDEDANRVGREGMAAGAAAEYVPDDPAVLAYTSMAQPGETVRVTFTAPSEPGRYRYICTFPGHYALMQGTMIVV